ncbi:MAG: glycosidase, partial [Bacteroidetes bacterium]|nr:glycosidase [Bacteroidota bacterium]
MRPIRPASARRHSAVMLSCLSTLVFLVLLPAVALGQAAQVRVTSDGAGTRLQVDGKDFMVIGMNWDYFPIGKNYTYSLWTQPDDIIEAALHREMTLLRNMGVNVIRQYVGVPPRWVRYIYERYGIWTILNHSLGRYGVTVDGVFVQQTDYSDSRTRGQLTAEIAALAEEFRDVPGLLMWLLGNENNYGLEWSSAETEAFPEGERQAAKAVYLYSLMGEVTRAIKAHDTVHPVAIANGDLQYLDIIAREAKGIDVFGTNMYRGISFGDAFERVKRTLGIPILFTEFGADAFDAKENREDQYTQARYLLGQWKEIYEQSSGKGRTGNAIGGLTFQFTDGWWKYKQESNLDVHDINASWPNDAYPEDFVAGQNNMNEEWWGVCAKGPSDARGIYEVYPRAAFYALQQAHRLDPYAAGTTIDAINRHFAAIDPTAALLQARGDRGAMLGEETKRLRISGLRMEMSTISTGGSNVSTPDEAAPFGTTRPAFRGFDHMESFYAEVEARPAENVSGSVSLNVLGHVPVNPIDELFYEYRGRARSVRVDGEPEQMTDIERVRVYRAQVSWDDSWFHLNAFYRTGHYHWGYEGD